MSMLWVVCGAGRGVGKTHLVHRLLGLLPDSDFAKCGHSSPKPGKPGNYFTAETELDAFISEREDVCKHVVVEFNGWACDGRGDVIIYLGPIAGKTDVRADADKLKANAHIMLTVDSPEQQWRNILRKRLPEEALCNAVLDALREHKRHLREAATEARR